MLKENEFALLYMMSKGMYDNQRDLAAVTDLSLGSVNATLKQLVIQGLVSGHAITAAGIEALQPYKVENAIIMAAGMSTRFAPISYEKPKGVLRVNGEVLIERQIEQLQQAGIGDITVVVGYMKEEFFYLEDKFDVDIVVNTQYAQRNNNSTLHLVQEKLGNTYICSSDNYFSYNVFEPYVYKAYYSAVYQTGPTDEYCLHTTSRNRIDKVTIGGFDTWVMMGHACFDKSFSKTFVSILNEVYDHPETKQKLWEDIYIDHIEEFDLTLRPYEEGIILEFDSLADVSAFDPDFIMNLDSSIFDNICSVLGCSRIDISDIVPIKNGLTNMSFQFNVAGTGGYVYRHPGVGTEAIIDRAAEAFAQGVAHDLGLDDTYLYQDPVRGWKMSKFVSDCVPFDYHDTSQVERGIGLLRQLHSSGVISPRSFDIHAETEKIILLLEEKGRISFPDFAQIDDRISRLYGLVSSEGVTPCLCHNDFYDQNFLVSDGLMYLIDWEYAGMSDYASDLGVFVCCSDYSPDEVLAVFEFYFGRELTAQELRHCIAYTAIASFYWFVWALYKEATGDSVGDYLYLWYRYAKEYGNRAEQLYA